MDEKRAGLSDQIGHKGHVNDEAERKRSERERGVLYVSSLCKAVAVVRLTPRLI